MAFKITVAEAEAKAKEYLKRKLKPPLFSPKV